MYKGKFLTAYETRDTSKYPDRMPVEVTSNNLWVFQTELDHPAAEGLSFYANGRGETFIGPSGTCPDCAEWSHAKSLSFDYSDGEFAFRETFQVLRAHLEQK